MKYKIIEESISYVELKADIEPDALREFMNTDDIKYIFSSRNLVRVEKIGDFERPNCKITISDNPEWNKIAIEISVEILG